MELNVIPIFAGMGIMFLLLLSEHVTNTDGSVNTG